MVLACAGGLGLGLAQEPFSNASLSGKYHFVQLLVSAPRGEARTLAGAITFDGAGAFTCAAEGASGGQGTYSVGGAGSVFLSSPLRPVELVSAYLGADRDVLVGASTDSPGSTYDFFVAVRAPGVSVTDAFLNGEYRGAWVEFAAGTPPVMKSALVALAAGGNGQFTRVSVLGHASEEGGRMVSQSAANATYSLRAAGSGTASFGTAATLLAGDREILVSQDGAYLLGHWPGRGILVAAKSFGAAATAASLDGRYWLAELAADGPSYYAAGGSLRAWGDGRALISERLRLDGRVLDYAGLNAYAVRADGSGALAPRLLPNLTNLALGPTAGSRAAAFVGAQLGPLETVSTQYGLFFGVRAPTAQGAGVFLDPAGAVNGASFAGFPHPVAPGAVVSLFGFGLASREAPATAFPLPTRLDDVAVSVNGAPAPLFFVSPTQVGIQLPYGLKGNWVTLRLANTRGDSNEVTARLAPTSPGVFFYGDNQSPFRAIVLHADYSLVSAQKPARPGETVMIWLTGLGELKPAVTTGAANPASPLALAVDWPVMVFFGGEPATRIDYAGGAPGFPALNQINAAIPVSAPVGASVPVAISTSTAYVDLVDIPISR